VCDWIASKVRVAPPIRTGRIVRDALMTALAMRCAMYS
jgi:hypothetical protein